MNERLTPPDWSQYDPNMLVNVSDMQYYYENFTGIVDERSDKNETDIGDLDSRVSALEHSTPVGPGGKGAYLDLGGTPDRYPTRSEMIDGFDGKETSFMVVARTDGLYFYNPKTKLLIPPKKGGGYMAVHAQFPQIFDKGHALQFDGRAGRSGVYTARTVDIGLQDDFLAFDSCKLLIVVNENGEEHQTALSPDGMASRIFRKGERFADWIIGSGSGGGGAVDPAIIQELNRRLQELEDKPAGKDEFTQLNDVHVDLANDTKGLVYVDEFGKIRADKVNPHLMDGSIPVNVRNIGAKTEVVSGIASGSVFARSPYVVLTSATAQQHTLCRFVAQDAANVPSTQTREGRVTYIANYSNENQTLDVALGQRFYVKGGMDSAVRVISPKTVHVYAPTILDNGSGAMTECWAILGVMSIDGGGTASSFTDLTDTPSNYTGQAHKSMRVNETEDGIEFIDSPEHAILGALEAGNLPIKWNNLKQKIAASSSNISANNIAENAFTLGLGGTAGRLYTLPDIVDANTSPLPVNSVREGRLTIISQQGGGTREVTLSAGCKFVMNGSASTDGPITIPPGQSWILLPAIYGNGEKTWSLIGTFSANPHTRDSFLGFNRVGSRGVYANSTFSNGQVSQTSINNSGLVSTYGTTNRTISLPEIIESTNTAWIKNHQVRVGKVYTFWGYEAAKMVLKPHAGQGFLINNESTTESRTLNPGIMETFMAVKKGDDFLWILLYRNRPDGSPVELAGIEDRLAAIESWTSGDGTVDLTPVLSRVEALEAELAPVHIQLSDIEGDIDSMDVRVAAVDAKLLEFMTHGLAPITRRMGEAEVEINDTKDRVEVLENKPNPSFFDLTNTPTAGRPGELIGYNLASNALVSYPRITKSTELSDTPSDLRGNATKLLTVKLDETGFEFTDYPRLGPLQVAIRDNKELIDAQAISDTEQKVRISSLEDSRTRAGHLPKIFEDGNTIKTDGRVGLSGVYTALPGNIGLSGDFSANVVCKVLVAVTKNGEELQTAFGEFAMASRVFAKNVNVAAWSTDAREGPIFRGVWDPKTNAYPMHMDTNSRWDVVFDPATPTFNFDGKTWRPGDRLVYVNETKTFSQMHTTLGVPSVNGKTGPVTLTADDVGAMKHTTSAVVDCDDLRRAGSFGVSGTSTNWPFGTTAGALIVFLHNNSYLTQLACSAGDNKMRVRTCNANKWSAWTKIYSEFEKPTADEIKAVNLNYGVGAAGKDVADMNVPQLKGGLFNSAANSAGAYANYMPFIQGVRAGGSDGTGQVLQMQANHLTKKFAYRTRVEGNWTDWVEPYSKYNLPTATDVKAMVRKEWDGDFNTLKEAGAYRFSGLYENGPEDASGGSKPTYSNLLHVSGGGDTNWQMIGDFRGKNLWWRGYNDSFINGGTWHRVFHTGNTPTPDELDLPYASRNKYDVRDYGVVGDGVTDDTDAFVRACNTVKGLNGTLTAPGHLRIKLKGVNRTVTVRCNMDLNNAVIDMKDFQGMIMFSRVVIDPVICWGAGKDPANPGNPEHPLITALQAEPQLKGGELKGWKDIAEVEDSYFMLNTEEPLFSYRGGIKNRCEYNKIGRWGQLESFIKYPMDPKKISRLMYWPMEKQMTVAQNIVFDLGDNDLQSPNVRIRTSNFTARNWRFIQDNFVNSNKNPTVVSVERSANIVLEDIYFQWATHTTATTGFTYNLALNDNYNVALKRVNGTGDGWGSTGSNNSRKVYFEQCNLSRVDFHEPMHEYLSLRDCHIGSWGVLATAMGDINIEGGTLFRKRNPETVDRNGFIRSRTDSGFCDGNINIRNVTIVADGVGADADGVYHLMEHQNDAPESDYIVPGSPVDFCFWKNITIDNVKFVGPEGTSLNLYPRTKCRDMALSGMRWPYAINITNCTGGNLIMKGVLDDKILPYKQAADADKGFIMSIPNHVVNVTESNLKRVDIVDTNPVRKFVVALNMDNINPGEKDTNAPGIKAKLGGSVSVRNSTINSVDFSDPLSPMLATLDGCKVIHSADFGPNVVNGVNPVVELSVLNSMVSTNTRESLDTIKLGTQSNNRCYIGGVKENL